MPEIKRYEEMKESGIEWIREIPYNWDIGKIKHYCSEIFSGGTPKSNIPEFWDGDIPWIPSGSCHDKVILKAPKYITELGLSQSSTKIIPANTPVMAMTGATCGNTGYVSFETCANQSVMAYVPNHNSDGKFLWYLLQAAKEFILLSKTGGAQGGVNGDNCKNIIVPMVPLEVQQAIADYLDTQCSQIDEIIEETKKSIEEYKKLKASVVQEAVTKGLNPDVEMKDSGIEWIGKIPKEWSVAKVLYCLEMAITDGPHTTPKLFDTGVPFVSAEAVSCGNGKIDFSHIRGYISEDFYQECCLKYIPKIDDIYMIKSGATTGKVAIVDTDKKFTIWSPLAVFRANRKRMLPMYLFFVLQAELFQKQVELGWNYGTQQNIGMRVLEQLKITIPSIKEQKLIVDYLQKRISNLDELISEKNKLITELENYKKSLIYEVITGKRKVV